MVLLEKRACGWLVGGIKPGFVTRALAGTLQHLIVVLRGRLLCSHAQPDRASPPRSLPSVAPRTQQLGNDKGSHSTYYPQK